MLELTLHKEEMFNENTGEFIAKDPVKVRFEHSLISLSKWESKYHKPFLSEHKSHAKTPEELTDYIRFMVVDDIDYDVIEYLNEDTTKQINDYIQNPMTATTVNVKTDHKKIGNELVTSELVYYWLVALQIPFETQTWHLNRLIMLIQVTNVKNTPPDKKAKPNAASRRQLNAQRRRQMGTRG